MFILESSRPSKSSAPASGKQSARWHVSKELYQTESNYVGILSTVLQVCVCVCVSVCVCVCQPLTIPLSVQLFKIPLDKEGQVGGPILAPEEMKTIFGSIPEIYDVHTRIKVGGPFSLTTNTRPIPPIRRRIPSSVFLVMDVGLKVLNIHWTKGVRRPLYHILKVCVCVCVVG